eukprot:15334215-Ditylum_brightwellii.AAC.1
MECVKLLFQKAKMHFYEDLDSESAFATNTRSTASFPPPQAVAISPRKHSITNNLNDLLYFLPIRKELPRKLHQLIWKQ